VGAVTGTPAGGGPVRLFVCDDAADFRLLLRYAAEDEPGLELVGEAADGEEGIAGVAATGPDVVLVDLSMPRVDGLEAIPRMLAAAPAARIVAMSGFPAEHMERRARDAGAAAYLQKGADLMSIVDAVRQVAAGGRGSA
jgi:DNA-binding NarL/FixJ family response regulator